MAMKTKKLNALVAEILSSTNKDDFEIKNQFVTARFSRKSVECVFDGSRKEEYPYSSMTDDTALMLYSYICDSRDVSLKITDFDTLKRMLRTGFHEYAIALNYGCFSRKHVSIGKNNTLIVKNKIDGSRQILSREELFDERKTNIGKAMANGAFYTMLEY